jgi:hypothetical protein
MARGKKTRSFSARFSEDVFDRLETHSTRLSQPKARVVERIVDEGLRMEEFPGIMFRTGPTGRRAGVVGGPDVWEIVRDVKGSSGEGVDDPISAVSAVTGLDRSKIELAVRYYSAYPEEVDERIRSSELAAERLQRTLGVATAA